jgi:beta-N-acetylhexosaminidase
MSRVIRQWLASAALLVLLAEAWQLKHPLMYWLRPWETPLLLLAGIGTAALLGSPQGLFRPGMRRMCLGLAAAIIVLTLFRETEFHRQREELLAGSMEMRELGEHFIIGFKDFESLRPLAARGLIGGIYLTRRNLRDRTLAEVAGEIRALQAVREQAGLPPLIVAADQEGGPVSHLSPLLEAMPPLASLASAGPERAKLSREYGRQQAEGLARLGVNLNFGPVVDLLPAGPNAQNDRLTCLASRAIGHDPEIVTEIAAGYIDGLASQGVGATLKHFPGLGRVQGETHLAAAKLNMPLAALADDWQPFQRLAGQQASAMMLAHVTLPELDAHHAASHSATVVGGLLRGRWGYQGLLITDDLNMGAVYDLGIGRVASEALAAGVDLILVSYDPDQYFRALQGAAAAWRDGKIDRQKLFSSQHRLANFRRHGLITKTAQTAGLPSPLSETGA